MWQEAEFQRRANPGQPLGHACWVLHQSNLGRAAGPKITEDALHPALPPASTAYPGQKARNLLHPSQSPARFPSPRSLLSASLCLPWLRPPCSPRTHPASTLVLKKHSTGLSRPCPATGAPVGWRTYKAVSSEPGRDWAIEPPWRPSPGPPGPSKKAVGLSLSLHPTLWVVFPT